MHCRCYDSLYWHLLDFRAKLLLGPFTSLHHRGCVASIKIALSAVNPLRKFLVLQRKLVKIYLDCSIDNSVDGRVPRLLRFFLRQSISCVRVTVGIVLVLVSGNRLFEFDWNDFFNFLVGFAPVEALVHVEVLLRWQIVHVKGLETIACVAFLLSKVFACFHHFIHSLPDVLLARLS